MGDRLQGKVAVVTGGASGIGAASVRRFVAEGANVVVADVQVGLGRSVAEALGDGARFVECDVTDEAAIVRTIERALDAWGRLDVMFNNAGVVGAVGPIADTSAEEWRRTIDVLLHSVFYGCKHATRVMVPDGVGSIINTTSIAGVLGGLGPHAYTAAKTAVVGLTKSVAAEIMSTGVRCNAIAPGTIPTPLTAAAIGAGTDDDRADDRAADLAAVRRSQLDRYGIAGDVEDIANGALYLASDESRFVNGHTLVIDAGRSVNGGSTRFASSEAGAIGIAPTVE